MPSPIVAGLTRRSIAGISVGTTVGDGTVRPQDAYLCNGPCSPVRSSVEGNGEAPVWAGNDVAMRLRDRPVPPRYPESLRRAGIDGTVLVRFVVDTAGRVDPGSIEIVRSTHDAFTASVRESVLKLRFFPAVAGKAKVPARAMMPFQFTLR